MATHTEVISRLKVEKETLEKSSARKEQVIREEMENLRNHLTLRVGGQLLDPCIWESTDDNIRGKRWRHPLENLSGLKDEVIPPVS
jgi:hypothetical protein